MHFHLVFVCVCRISGPLTNLQQRKMDIMRAQVFAEHAGLKNQQFFFLSFFLIWLYSCGLYCFNSNVRQTWACQTFWNTSEHLVVLRCLYIAVRETLRFPALDVKFMSLVWHNSTQADYIRHREHICVRQVTRDRSLKTACTLVHCVVRERAHTLGKRWAECNRLPPMNVNRSLIDENKQRLYVYLLFDCISLQIQWLALLNSLMKALSLKESLRLVNRRSPRPRRTASWWLIIILTTTILCFCGKISIEDNQSRIYSLWFYYTNSPKRHCASRLDYKPAERETITVEAWLTQQK